ncbi:hypothetical protein ANN_07420 [Periplaneta americana]|uniref:Uncharacterized protein n=1 Tax=Periplaneta americana TaxID=6978 RepID=A0ABQ8SZ87_PERAM|nr:hypothetical protein ANN_07420 [Periplaneta americana]
MEEEVERVVINIGIVVSDEECKEDEMDCDRPEKVRLNKHLSRNNIMSSFQDPGADVNVSLLLKSGYFHIGVVIDLECKGSINFISAAEKSNHLKLLHQWLVLAMTYKPAPQGEEDQLTLTLEPLTLPVDNQLMVARPGSHPEQILLQEMYRLAPHLPIITTPLVSWSPGQLLPDRVSRQDYHGIILNSALVARDEPLENFRNLYTKDKNTVDKCSYELTSLISEMLNFTMNITMVDAWGYPKKGTDCYDGVVGALQCGYCVISASGIFYKNSRWDRLDYAGESSSYKLSFKFLKPSLSEVSIIYTLPFSRSVWITYMSMVAVLAVALYVTEKLERYMNPREEPPLVFGDAALNSLAIVCAEGTPRSPDNMSSRIVFLFLLLLALFLTTSYSAIIVSLLQTPSDAINTLTELLDSPFKLSMRNISYNTKYVNDSTDPEIKRLFYQKLYTRPPHEAFTSERTGIESIRKGLYAFHTAREGYRYMSETYEEYEKCKLKEIQIIPSSILGFPVKKNSMYKEHITLKARVLKETGMTDRAFKRWFPQKPICGANSQGFVSVRIKDFYPTLVVLSIGLLGSIVLIFIELIYHKAKYGTYWPAVNPTAK